MQQDFTIQPDSQTPAVVWVKCATGQHVLSGGYYVPNDLLPTLPSAIVNRPVKDDQGQWDTWQVAVLYYSPGHALVKATAYAICGDTAP